MESESSNSVPSGATGPVVGATAERIADTLWVEAMSEAVFYPHVIPLSSRIAVVCTELQLSEVRHGFVMAR